MKSVSTAILLLALLLLLPASGFGEHEPFSQESRVEWQHARLVLELRAAVDPGELYPDLRYRVQREAERLLPALIVEALLPLPLDSFQTVGDRLHQDERLFQAVSDAAAAGMVEDPASFSRNLQEIRLRYRVPFHGPDGLITPFVTHSRPFPMRTVLGFVPTRAFGGLVIYAKGSLPAHGKDVREQVRPAFFPKLWDEEMGLVLSAEMCLPEALRARGMVAYSYGEGQDSAAGLERVGAFPLRTAARGVFGKNSTDILLSMEAARQLLSLEANRQMLRECRVLIIIDPPASR